MDASFSGKPPKTTAETQIAFNLRKCEFEDQYGQHVALWLFGDQSSEIKKINLCQIFSYGNPYGEYDPINIIKLGRELSHATVTISLHRMPPYRKEIVSSHHFSGNTVEHKVLCARSALWLQEQGIQWVGSRWYPGGLSDVTAVDKTIAVECGYTNAYKALDSLMNGWSFMVVPYERECSAALDDNYNDELIGFYFAPLKELIYQYEIQEAFRDAEKTIDKLRDSSE